jgi:hypothetical protein
MHRQVATVGADTSRVAGEPQKKGPQSGPTQIVAAVVLAVGAIIAAMIISSSHEQPSRPAPTPVAQTSPATTPAAATEPVVVAPSDATASTDPSAVDPAAGPPECVARAKAVSRALRALDSRLKVGLNVGEYTSRVGDVRVEYDDQASQPGPCEEAFQDYDDAITTHTDAASDWQICIDDYPSCFVDTVGLSKSYGGVRDFRLYKRWNRADRSAAQGDAALRALQ